MGATSLRSMNSGLYGSNGYESIMNENSKVILAEDLFQFMPPGSQIVYRSNQPLAEAYLERVQADYGSSDEVDKLNQYAYFLKTSRSNMDTSNLYLPYEIRRRTSGMCDQTQTIDLFYPLYEYKMIPQLQARLDRRQNFSEPEIWYLIMSVLNGMRQFQRIKCISKQFSINSIRFNSLGLLKIQNMLSSPLDMQKTRNERFYWSHKDTSNFYAQQTYRLALVVLSLCTMTTLSTNVQQMKFKQLRRNTIQRQIQKALQFVQTRYSDLLYNLVTIMLSHPRDRPLPSQIYQIFAPYKNQIMQFRQFTFNPSTAAMIRNNLMNSNFSRNMDYMGDGNVMSMHNSLPLQNRGMYNSYKPQFEEQAPSMLYYGNNAQSRNIAYNRRNMYRDEQQDEGMLTRMFNRNQNKSLRRNELAYNRNNYRNRTVNKYNSPIYNPNNMNGYRGVNTSFGNNTGYPVSNRVGINPFYP